MCKSAGIVTRSGAVHANGFAQTCDTSHINAEKLLYIAMGKGEHLNMARLQAVISRLQ